MENIPISSTEQNTVTTTQINNTPPKTPAVAPVITIDQVEKNPQIPIIENKPPLVTMDNSTKKSSSVNFLAILRGLATACLILAGLAHAWINMDLSVENKYFSKIGVKSTGQVTKEQSEKIQELENEQFSVSRELSKIQKKIQAEEFSEFYAEINNIRDLHINWFDTKDKDGLKIGLFDASQKVVDYFKSSAFKDDNGIIPRGNDIEITTQSINRDTANISITISQKFKRLFYLANEFTKQMNAYPFFKDGNLSEFSRVENENGDDTMEFSINLSRQSDDEDDIFDTQFPAFNSWVNSK